ncbi:ogr/Delta-like zinc finger family protein [Serratia odorifera]|uniref:ogr/Delta-like zinc finger family protein n=1 Tax=Serratia odorifera TaxID=618 RepID=UPI003531B4CA
MTIRQYHQCQNFECSITFTTLNSVEKLVTKRGSREEELPPDFILQDAFPTSHYGRDQPNLPL